MARLKTLLRLVMSLGFLFFPYLLQAVEITPFSTQNQSPLVQIFGLPSIDKAILLPAGKADVRLILDQASNYIEDSNSRESILLDGESTRITFSSHYGLIKRFEVGLEVPFLIQGGGFLDDFLIGYHNAFGFPQGGRDKAPRNRLLYQYWKDGQERLKMDRSGYGLGDIHLNGAWQLYARMEGQPRAVALRASLKFPTGDSAQLLGSGSTDFSLWVTVSDDYQLTRGHLTLLGAAGVMAMTEGKVLRDQQRNLVWFGSLGIGWSPFLWLAFKIQTNAHTPFYQDSELRELNAASAQFIIGGTLAFSERTTLDIGVVEDIIVKTSPDVVFHFALRQKF